MNTAENDRRGTAEDREVLVRVITDARSDDDHDLGESIGDRPLADLILAAGFSRRPVPSQTPEPTDAARLRAAIEAKIIDLADEVFDTGLDAEVAHWLRRVVAEGTMFDA